MQFLRGEPEEKLNKALIERVFDFILRPIESFPNDQQFKNALSLIYYNLKRFLMHSK